MRGYARIKRKLHREDGRVLVSLTVGNECGCEDIEFLILEELYAELGDEVLTDEIECDTVERLNELADVTAAFSSACASLAFTQCSSKALLRKLISKGFSKSASEVAIDICSQRGYIDEISVATRRAEVMVDKLWGRIRILAKLCEEGYSDEAIESAREYLDSVDFSEICASVIEKKYHCIPEDRMAREKMYAALMRLGFSRGDIRDAIQKNTNDY